MKFTLNLTICYYLLYLKRLFNIQKSFQTEEGIFLLLSISI